eukprot:92387-Pyramimonas_sp.AAC.1
MRWLSSTISPHWHLPSPARSSPRTWRHLSLVQVLAVMACSSALASAGFDLRHFGVSFASV